MMQTDADVRFVLQTDLVPNVTALINSVNAAFASAIDQFTS